MTSTTYRAVYVSKPGRLELVERELTAPLPRKVMPHDVLEYPDVALPDPIQ
jgi:hypothetical protein